MNKKLKLCFLLLLFLFFNTCNLLQGPGGNNGDKLQYKIIFESYRSGVYNIYMMNLDGSDVTQISFSSVSYRMPSFSNDASLIAFYTNSKITTMNRDGSGITTLSSATGNCPIYSPDKTKIIYNNTSVSPYQLYTINSDGSGISALFSSPSGYYDYNPSYSPDGSKILFTRYSTMSSQQLYTVNVSNPDSTLTALGSSYNSNSNQIYARYSFEGSKIVFNTISTSLTSSSIYTMNSDGSNTQIIATSSTAVGSYYYPSFTPDGRIVYVYTPVSTYIPQIYIMDADGSNKTNLSNNSYNNSYPSVSGVKL